MIIISNVRRKSSIACGYNAGDRNRFRKTERGVREILLRRKKGYCALNIIIIYIIGIIHRRFLRTYAEYNESTIK